MSAVLTLAILLLLLQTLVSGAMGVVQVAAAVGSEAHFVICSPLSPGGVRDAGDDGSAMDYHCPLCRVASVSALPAPFDNVDLGPAFVLELIDRLALAAVEAPQPQPLALTLAPDRTGPPAGRR